MPFMMEVQHTFLEGHKYKEEFPNFLFEVGSHYIGQAGFTLEADPPASASEGWNYRCYPPQLSA